jgi:4-amino-4-deoxy-L-arabinose transferase-like glycosyltransferase
MLNAFTTKTKMCLIVLIASSFLVRFWQSNVLPAALNRDEAALGYNAQLLSETGQDEWGKHWPLALESFGDYKLPGYVWLTIAAGKLFGWQDWTVRLPSIVAGSILPVLVFSWLKFSKKTHLVAWSAAVFVAFAPFSWFYSRMAFEANVALSLWVGWFCLITVKKNQLTNTRQTWWLDLFIWLIALAAILTYNTPLLLLPLLLLGLPWFWEFKYIRQWWLTWLGLALITWAGFMGLTQLFGQKSAITLFSDPTIFSQFITFRQALSGWHQLIFGNWWVYLSGQIGWRWLQTWLPHFLVTTGGTHPWHAIPGAGHLYWSLYLLGLTGVIGTLISTIKNWRTLLSFSFPSQAWWLFLTIISLAPAIITVDAPHATRSLLFLVLFCIWAAEGLQLLTVKLKNPKLIVGLITLLFLLETSWYGYRYFTQYAQQQTMFQPGLSTVIQKLNQLPADTKIAIVADGYQYIVWAWYGQIPPNEFFATIHKQLPDRIGFRYGDYLKNYHFIAAPTDRTTDETVLVQWQADQWQIQTF